MKRIFFLLHILIVSMILVLGSCKARAGSGGSGCPGHGGYSTENITAQPINHQS